MFKKLVCALFVSLVMIHSPAFAFTIQIPTAEIQSLFKSVVPGMTRDEAHSKALEGTFVIGRSDILMWLADDFIGVYWSKASVGIYFKDDLVRCVNYYISDGERIVEEGFNTLEKNLKQCNPDN